MMEFIVLGQVPGTSIYLSFSTVAILIGIVAATTAVYTTVSPRRSIKKDIQKIQEIAL